MDQQLTDEIIKVLMIFGIEAYEHEDENPNDKVVCLHHITVGNLRRARGIIKELEKFRKAKYPLERARFNIEKAFIDEDET